jgi:hypothetical protein
VNAPTVNAPTVNTPTVEEEEPPEETLGKVEGSTIHKLIGRKLLYGAFRNVKDFGVALVKG